MAALAATLGLAAAGLGGAPAAAARIKSFQAPHHTFGCVYSTHPYKYLRCDVRRPEHPLPRPQSCPLDYGNAFGMTARGRARALCAGDTALGMGPKLHWGAHKRLGPFRCHLKRHHHALRCVNRRGHGWALSRAKQRLF